MEDIKSKAEKKIVTEVDVPLRLCKLIYVMGFIVGAGVLAALAYRLVDDIIKCPFQPIFIFQSGCFLAAMTGYFVLLYTFVTGALEIE